MAQLDAAISLDMTARQLAWNCGGTVGSVAEFAARNGRRFNGYSVTQIEARATGTASITRRRTVAKLKAAYMAGEPVEMWGAQ
ncbi:hypothetical protein C7I85_12120 [Mesorhizobium soli]|uniref:Uncharacterized protein n=2 Tax=Pseudaminobacter soli (ex Li et al. 2025) TaxID=1295366 RepID=A0A2P7SEP6_9HYPH|nr:hypothetical protein C7I85_12120 [Mesorhizobium soli]